MDEWAREGYFLSYRSYHLSETKLFHNNFVRLFVYTGLTALFLTSLCFLRDGKTTKFSRNDPIFEFLTFMNGLSYKNINWATAAANIEEDCINSKPD